IFPKASGDPFSPALPNRRQDNVFDTRNGYSVANPLGIWTAQFVSFTAAAFNTAEGKATLAHLAALNGTDLDGTPILKTAMEIDGLVKKGFAIEQHRNFDGSQGFPWIIWPIIQDPRGGSIAKDAFLDFVKRPDGTPVDPEVVIQFISLQQTGKFSPSLSNGASVQQAAVDALFALAGIQGNHSG